jgi:DNA primase
MPARSPGWSRLLDWLDNGFVEPESVQLASADYKHDSDPLSNFLRLCTVPDPEARVQSSVLYETYQAWCKAAGEYEWKQKGFSQALKAKGLANKASNGMHWLGIRLVKTRRDFVDAHGNVVDMTDDAAGSSAAAPRPPHPPLMTLTMMTLPGLILPSGRVAEGSAEGRKGRKTAALEGLEGSP